MQITFMFLDVIEYHITVHHHLQPHIGTLLSFRFIYPLEFDWQSLGLRDAVNSKHSLHDTKSSFFFLHTTFLEQRSSLSLRSNVLQRIRNIMMGFKNRYMVMEVFVDPSRDVAKEDPIIISQYNVSKAIKDNILVNFGECGLAASLGSFQIKYVNSITKLCIIRASREEFQKVWASITMIRSIGNCSVIFNLLDLSGSIKACRKAALECDTAKFEQYKQVVGDQLTPEVTQQVHNCFERIKVLEH